MAKQIKVAKLLSPTVPLVLEVEGDNGPIQLKLHLAWTMKAVILIEAKLREQGVHVNALQNPSLFWRELDCTRLALGVWATALQEQPQYADDDGFDAIASFLVPENYAVAADALKRCFTESLSKKRRDEIKAAEEEAAKKDAEAAKEPEPDPMMALDVT